MITESDLQNKIQLSIFFFFLFQLSIFYIYEISILFKKVRAEENLEEQ